jgi:hypothetical protein
MTVNYLVQMPAWKFQMQDEQVSSASHKPSER